MAKRTAQTDLTDRNWDDEEEPEEAGVFKQASKDVISNRQIKKAKRRVINEEEDDKPSSFSGFSGFGLKPKVPADTSTTPVGTDHSENMANSLFSVKKRDDVNGLDPNKKKESQYFQDLRNLNESVVAWIKQHVEKNPLCILTPVFKDYEKHLADIEKSDGESKAVIDLNIHTSTFQDTKEKGEKNLVEKKMEEKKWEGEKQEETKKGEEKKEEIKKAQTLSGFQFGTLSGGSATSMFGNPSSSSTNGFSTLSSTNSFPGFSFKTNTSDLKPTFSFASQCSQKLGSTDSQPEKGGEDDEYVPPEPETREIKEDGEIYKNRCKLFYQKENKWTERGVGNLHLKPVDKKLQLIVRADTNLGNIMLNIFLTCDIPVKKQGKNNVSFVCLPNPPIDPKADAKVPVPMLIRVKTSEDADNLIKIIEDNLH
ncbi:nuclear pore complex protein Nup50-like isoform X2 [Gigantopelta aegis]|nr:nuclear pore complex protein Nup50-like isoform X2 [Gigantopelta aegis]XP_041365240.1 nuclear pore complex protein Nup50-like isoform X2 [Gigantopelta aegis]XP_041365241.1 nuclear pore complex protein Nup50-like isoform X2 [Gigantopelta aegis]